MNKLKKIMEKKINDNNNIVFYFDNKINNEYENSILIRKNMKKIINPKDYPVIFIDVSKYYKEIIELFKGEINKYPYILKYENKELSEAYDKFINFK